MELHQEKTLPKKHNILDIGNLTVFTGPGLPSNTLGLEAYFNTKKLPDGSSQKFHIEFPEKYWHPQEQIAMAQKIIKRVVEGGENIFLLTQSDYMIVEFSTAIMLHYIADLDNDEETEFKDKIARQIRLKKLSLEKELIPFKLERFKMRIYDFYEDKIIDCELHPYKGIKVPSINEIVNKQSEIIDEIVWGG